MAERFGATSVRLENRSAKVSLPVRSLGVARLLGFQSIRRVGGTKRIDGGNKSSKKGRQQGQGFNPTEMDWDTAISRWELSDLPIIPCHGQPKLSGLDGQTPPVK